MTVAVLSLSALVARPTHAPLSLQLLRGERVLLASPNGLGKTSIIRCIFGALSTVSGSARVLGRVGYAPQDYRASLLPWLSAADNVALAARILPRSLRAAAIERAIDVVGLTRTSLTRSPSQLSGGGQQRVSLARALAFDPEIALFDEPFCALDARARASIIERLDGHLSARGVAMVLVTHQLDDALALGASVVQLRPSSEERAA